MNKLYIFLLAVILITGFSVTAWADRSANLYQIGSQQAGISERQAISIAQQHIKGRVLDIKRRDNLYRIKILSDQGSVHVVQVNAMNGKIQTGH